MGKYLTIGLIFFGIAIALMGDGLGSLLCFACALLTHSLSNEQRSE
jgi:hypothetical protein